MLLLFVAATVTHTPAFGQLSYSLPPEKVERSYKLPNYEMKNNSVSPQEETVTTENQIVEVEKEKKARDIRFIWSRYKLPSLSQSSHERSGYATRWPLSCHETPTRA